MLKRVVPVVLIIALLVFAGTRIFSCVSSKATEGGESRGAVSASATYEPTTASLASIPASVEGPAGFTLASEDASAAPAMTEGQLAAVNAVLAHYAPNNRTVGFAFLNLETGKGYAYNVDADVYGASTIKAPVAVYACQQVEAGSVSQSSIYENVENAITWSDNKSYHRLSNTVDASGAGTGFASWLEGMGVDPTILADADFGTFSTRELLTMWMATYLWLESGDSELTEWMKGLFSSTETSNIRAGVTAPSVEGAPAMTGGLVAWLGASLAVASLDPVESVEAAEVSGDEAGAEGATQGDAAVGGSAASSDGSDGGFASGSADEPAGDYSISADQVASQPAQITVYNKAGWIAGDSYNAINDAAIIIEGDSAYLMCIMTGAPDTEENHQLAANLAKALWATRATLSA